MKKMILLVLSVLIAGFSFFSCDLLGNNTFTFQNDCDHDVTVEPRGQSSWQGFTLEPGEEMNVSIPEDAIFYFYSPEETTGVDTSEEGVIRFINAYTYVFDNDSDYDVQVKPDGQSSWGQFTLSPGGSKSITIPESSIFFMYNQADFINCDTAIQGTIRFYNKTILAIQNLSSTDLELVKWNGLYWGNDLIWDPGLSQYIYGIASGNGYYREVSPGSDYISFWFPSGGPQYRTVQLVTVLSEEQWVFTFYDSTLITERSLNPSSQDVEDAVPIIGTGEADRAQEAEEADAEGSIIMSKSQSAWAEAVN